MPSQNILVAYNPTNEAADGLALARVLEQRLGCELLVAQVLTDGTRSALPDLKRQRAVRQTVADTRQAILAALPEAANVELTTVADGSVAKSLHDVALAEDVEAIVVGSSHLHGLGRRLLGGGPELIADGAPCPVFVAPPGFRDCAALAPEVIGAAYDGTSSADRALDYAADLADRLAVRLRVIGVRPAWYGRPAGSPRDFEAVLADAAAAVRERTGGRVAVQTVEHRGAPVAELAAETDGVVGLLVIGSRGSGPLRRVLLGSVSAAVLRAAKGPVAVVPA